MSGSKSQNFKSTDMPYFIDGSADKAFTCNVGYLGSIPGLGKSLGERKGYPLQCSGLYNSMDSRWDRKESHMTEQLSFSMADDGTHF